MNFDALENRVAPITDCLVQDHHRLDGLANSAFAARERGDFAAAAQLFEAFAEGLSRHIAFEEGLLFPAFERETGMGTEAGPTAVMREEHRQIGELLEEIARGMREPAASIDDSRRTLAWVLEEHNRKEEQVLYPMTDQALGSERAERLVAEIEAFRV